MTSKFLYLSFFTLYCTCSSLGTRHYLCSWGRGGDGGGGGVKAISDWPERGLNVFYKEVWGGGGDQQFHRKYIFQISKYSFFSLFQS